MNPQYNINRNLEKLARQLYDYWFVQFDFPNKEGKPYKSGGGEMTYNNQLKRYIPRNWEVVNLFDGVDVQYGFPFSTALFVEEKTDKPVIRIRDILNGTISAYTNEDVDEKYRMAAGDVIVGMDGNFHINIWHNNTAYLNQRCVRLRAKPDNPISSLQTMFEIAPYIKLKEKNAKGSTVGHLSDKDLKAIYVLKPDFDSRSTFDSLLAGLIHNKSAILIQHQLRDELLPLLLNSQVSVGSVNVYDFKPVDMQLAAEPGEVNCDLSHYHICFQFLFPADVPQYTGKKLYICAIRH